MGFPYESLIIPIRHRPKDSDLISDARKAALGLPAGLWHSLFVVALKRLDLIKPQWARDLLDEVAWFSRSWIGKKNLDEKAGLEWLVEALTYMEDRELGRGKMNAWRTRDSDQGVMSLPAFIAVNYRRLRAGLSLLRKAWRASPKRQADRKALLASMQDLVKRIPIIGLTDKLVEDYLARLRGGDLPSELAIEILSVSHKMKPSYMRRRIQQANAQKNPLLHWIYRIPNPK